MRGNEQYRRRLRLAVLGVAILSLASFGDAQQPQLLPPVEEEEQRRSGTRPFAPPVPRGAPDRGDPVDGYGSSDFLDSPELDRLPPVVEFAPPVSPSRPPFRLLQKRTLTGTWLSGGGADGLGMTEASVSATTFIPFPVLGSPILVTPSFGVTQFDSPLGIDLPSEVYRASATLMWMKKSSDRVSYMVALSPGISSDLEATDQAFRLFGFGLMTYQWTPTVQLTLGAAYTGRNDLPVLPNVGLIWTPTEDWRVEVTAPRPRVARRLHHLPWSDSGGEDWVYLAGELGGGTWAVRQPSGVDDLLTIRDFRLLLGYERKLASGCNGRIEVGYVFGREIEFEDDPTEFAPSDTFMIRSGFSF
ncbi:hypothetical protein Pla8534_03340 [Lignipirellula cremea]|uniref:DUF6268 domain-containing protein n=2 Tax=Lignipirellula cremea TaxID=2528010 RepID=A0A518DL71_9BACT|nr:hypothetical protein Pla8534_03340 [Lignipirellula cremea]